MTTEVIRNLFGKDIDCGAKIELLNKKCYYSKCFVLAVAHGIKSFAKCEKNKIYTFRDDEKNICEKILQIMKKHNIGDNELIDTSIHSDFIEEIRKEYNVGIEIYTEHGGSLFSAHDKWEDDNNELFCIVNILCRHEHYTLIPHGESLKPYFS